MKLIEFKPVKGFVLLNKSWFDLLLTKPVYNYKTLSVSIETTYYMI